MIFVVSVEGLNAAVLGIEERRQQVLSFGIAMNRL